MAARPSPASTISACTDREADHFASLQSNFASQTFYVFANDGKDSYHPQAQEAREKFSL